MMIRPVNFGFNAETAVNNAFQVAGLDDGAQEKALEEFDHFVEVLRSNDIDVTVIDDTVDPYTPDSIFPNNWISFHSDGHWVLYPMFAPNRRLERKQHVIDRVLEKFDAHEMIDLSAFENQDIFLEGTGSMVLDRDSRIAYACLSRRTNTVVLNEFCKKMNYTPIVFDAVDMNGLSIYHTNVMMCVGDRYVVICLDSIPNLSQKNTVRESITNSGKEIISISPDQMNHFAGNMLQVENVKGKKLLVMSSQAFHSLRPEQIIHLETFNPIIHASLDTIETNGGGSARCMMAEVHLPLR